VPIVFCENRQLAQEWAYRFRGAAAAFAEDEAIDLESQRSVGTIRHPCVMASGQHIPGDDPALRMESLDAWLDELDDAHGPVSPEAAADARRWWVTAKPVIGVPNRAD
jgi:hypothetical protein